MAAQTPTRSAQARQRTAGSIGGEAAASASAYEPQASCASARTQSRCPCRPPTSARSRPSANAISRYHSCGVCSGSRSGSGPHSIGVCLTATENTARRVPRVRRARLGRAASAERRQRQQRARDPRPGPDADVDERLDARVQPSRAGWRDHEHKHPAAAAGAHLLRLLGHRFLHRSTHGRFFSIESASAARGAGAAAATYTALLGSHRLSSALFGSRLFGSSALRLLGSSAPRLLGSSAPRLFGSRLSRLSSALRAQPPDARRPPV